MTIVASTVDSNKITAYNANKPLFLAKNMLADVTTNVTGGTGPETISACWRIDNSLSTSPLNTTASGTVSNNSDSFQHPLLACDHQLTGTSAPYVSSGRTHALIFACEYSTTTPIDSIVIANHNFAEIAGAGSAGSDLRVKVAISTANNFTSHTIIQEWEAPFTKERLVSLDLGNALGATGAYASYTKVRFLQVFMYGAASINGPQIGEVFAGPRRQLSRMPLFDSYDTDSTSNMIGSFVSKAGNETRYSIASGREIQTPVFTPGGDADLGVTDLYTLNDYATLQSFWADTKYGTNPFFFLPNVSGKTGECFFMYADNLIFPSKIISGLADHEVDFAFTEIAPFYSSEV